LKRRPPRHDQRSRHLPVCAVFEKLTKAKSQRCTQAHTLGERWT